MRGTLRGVQAHPRSLSTGRDQTVSDPTTACEKETSTAAVGRRIKYAVRCVVATVAVHQSSSVAVYKLYVLTPWIEVAQQQ